MTRPLAMALLGYRSDDALAREDRDHLIARAAAMIIERIGK
jgi:hypothetical protein